MLADEFPNLHVVVQDLPGTIARVDTIAKHSRVAFQAQDFFEANQAKDADLFLFRWVLHDWPDALAVKILRALIPALKPGSRIVVNDGVGPGQAGKMPYYEERFVREIDMIMLSAFNSYEREKEDWERIFREADKRFGKVSFEIMESSLMGVIEVVWNG